MQTEWLQVLFTIPSMSTAIEQVKKWLVYVRMIYFGGRLDPCASQSLNYIASNPFCGDPFLTLDHGAATMK